MEKIYKEDMHDVTPEEAKTWILDYYNSKITTDYMGTNTCDYIFESVYTAEKARAINDANILCMGGWIIAPILGVAMAKAFLETEFTQNLEDWRANNLKKAKVEIQDKLLELNVRTEIEVSAEVVEILEKENIL